MLHLRACESIDFAFSGMSQIKDLGSAKTRILNRFSNSEELGSGDTQLIPGSVLVVDADLRMAVAPVSSFQNLEKMVFICMNAHMLIPLARG